MAFTVWALIAGGLLLTLALAAAYLRELPAAPSVFYLIAGFAVGPTGLGLVRLDLTSSVEWLDPLVQVGVIVALFFGGLKLRADWRDPLWRPALWLAGPGMLASILLVTVFGQIGLGFSFATALLLGAILSPTDPLLAEMVTVGDASDRDRVRFSLSGEAGLNDGLAFPMVLLALGLHRPHDGPGWLLGWLVRDEIWGVGAALLIGFGVGLGGGLLAIRFRSKQGVTSAPSDFLALALIAVGFAITELVGAVGFLAAFAAGYGMRSAEVHMVSKHSRSTEPDAAAAPAEQLVTTRLTRKELQSPVVAAGVVVSEMVSFGDTAERLLTFLLVAVIGVLLPAHWDARAIPLAAVLFFLIRPLAARVVLGSVPLRKPQRWLIGWFGLRGMASLYFAVFLFTQDIGSARTGLVANLAISVIALSIIVHGLSTPAIMGWYRRQARLKQQGR